MPNGTQGYANPGLPLYLAWDQGSAGSFLSLWPLSFGPFSELRWLTIISPAPCSERQNAVGVKTEVLEFRQVGVWTQPSCLLDVWLEQVIYPLWATYSCL